LIIPHLPIDVRAPAADVREVEHHAVPARPSGRARAPQAPHAVEARGVDAERDCVARGAQGGDARSGSRVLGGERGGIRVEAGGVDVRGAVLRREQGQRGGEGEVACVCSARARAREGQLQVWLGLRCGAESVPSPMRRT